MTFASSIVYLVYYGTIYSVPIICSLLFSILGLTFWIDAKGSHTVCRYKLVIGSLFIAFTLQCRPAFILIFVLAIPIFWDELVKDRLFFKKGTAQYSTGYRTVFNHRVCNHVLQCNPFRLTV